MTEPSQYFKGRTVQEQMDEVIGYVDKRAEEVATAKADAVLQPAEQAKTAAQAAAQQAEAAKDTTLAALPEIRQDISGLKAEDTALDGRLDTVELKVTTAEGNIVTIQGQIVALQTADGQNVKLTGEHAIGNYAVLLTGNQDKSGNLNLLSRTDYPNRNVDIFNPPSYIPRGIAEVKAGPGDANTAMREEFTFASGGNTLGFVVHCGDADGVTDHTATLMFTVFRDGKARLQLQRESGTIQIVPQG